MHKNDILRLTVKESGYKQSRVTPHFSNGQNLLKKILRKESGDVFSESGRRFRDCWACNFNKRSYSITLFHLHQKIRI